MSLPTMTRALLAALLLRPALCSISLNVSGPDWDYTASDLASTASDACRTAYSAAIDCTDTLLGVVASMRPAFDPQAADLDAMCTPACNASLAAYVAAVRTACDQPGDLANEAQGNTGVPKDPVYVVGEVFQYEFAQACAKDDSGSYCRLADEATESSFPCTDTCQVQFYANAHNYPGSAWFFNYYYLCAQSEWWDGEFQTGWAVAKACGAADLTGNSTAGAASTTTTPTTGPGVTETGTVAPSGTGTVAVDGRGTETGSASTSAAGPTSSSAAEGGRVGGLGKSQLAAWMGLILAVL